MEANATISLFNVTLNIKEHNEIEMEIDLLDDGRMFTINKCNHNYKLYTS